MKNMQKKLLALTLLFSTAQLYSTPVAGTSFFLPRAQNGTAVDILGWSPEINKYDADAIYFDFKAQSEWRQSFDSSKLGQYIFFNGTNTMIFGPQNTGTTNTSTDVYSLNFMLAPGFQSTVVANPKVQSSITDFSLYVGFDEWVSGLWVMAHLPLVYTRWNTHLSETITTQQPSTGFAAGVLDTNAVTTMPYQSVIQAWVGNQSAGDAVPWKYGTIDGSQSKTRVGDIAVTLGYNFVNRENVYLGVGLRGLFGAGGHSKAEYVFEPMVGYGGRMGIGGFIDGQVRVWERDENHNFVATASGYAVHLFNSKQVRSFDLTNCGVGSRYNMVKKLTTVTAATSTYSNIDNMINVGTQTAKIGIGVAYEANLQLSYTRYNMNLDLGYSVGGRSKEKFSSFVTQVTPNTYILYSSTAASAANVATAAAEITGVSKITVSGNDTGSTAGNPVTTANAATYCISSSNAATGVTALSLNTASVLAPAVVSNCLYLNIGYTWRDNDWCPNVSLFTDVEFTGNKSLSTWGIGLQGNVSY